MEHSEAKFCIFALVTHGGTQNLRTRGKKTSGKKVEGGEEIKKVKKSHYILPAMPKGSACTLLGPICKNRFNKK